MDANFCQGSVPDASRWRRPPWASSRPTTRGYGDRFIPNRVDMDVAEALLHVPRKDESTDEVSPSRAAYRKLLAVTMLRGRTRILSFSNQLRTPLNSSLEPPILTHIQPAKRRRHIPQGPERTLHAPNIVADDEFNILDWGSKDIIAISLADSVYLWNENGSTTELVTVTESSGPITSVCWAPDGRRIAIGQSDSMVVLYDVTTMKQLRTLCGGTGWWVGSIAWNNDNLLTTGAVDGSIEINDLRIQSHVISSFCGHDAAVCGLQWSSCGNHLASGGKDQQLNIWDISRTLSPLHQFNHHTAAVRAVAWCPFENNLLASGGCETDNCIKFWNVRAGTCVKSVDTGSEVCGLLWNKEERELLSSHGPDKNQIALWKYPSMSKIAELTGHTSSVLYMSQSPDGCKVASASDDETLKVWNIYEKSTEKKAPKSHYVGPTNMFSYIR
ncbi:hypothetical protein LUZ61_003812 [Rhynchospora tenuis]|uniref:CDC20/Fizzy WD40 domain-containing protein n=1 Tax=Rhynchospora tenuis TaxID=198213 RepID=A0AAD6ET17_9POAL|nr:hypothetical protein LUZ61_003812 [Rhynchospora tenuis]